MIKKIIIIMAMLMAAIAPSALADAAYPTYLTDGDFITVDYEVMTNEVEIGSEFECEITITSVSRSPLQLTYIYLEGIGHYFDLSSITDTDNMDGYINIKPYEQITLEVSFTVDTWLSNIYKTGQDFYVDTRPVVYYLDDWETYEYELKEEGESAPVKITNLNDGSKFIEFEWLDDRDTFYYNAEKVQDIGSEQGEKTYWSGEMQVSYKYTNVSGQEMFGVAPGGDYIADGFFQREDPADAVGPFEYNMSFVFTYEGMYYCILSSREYNIGFLEPPAVKLEYHLVSQDNSKGTKTYEFTVTNASEGKIEDFFLSTDYLTLLLENGTFEYYTIEAGEALQIEHTYEKDRAMDGLAYGVLLDGILYEWSVWLDYPVPDEISLEPYEQIWYPYIYDYDWYTTWYDTWSSQEIWFNYYMYEDEDAFTSADNEVSLTRTPASQEAEPAGDEESGALPSEAPADEITVKSRFNPMLWMLFIVLALVFAAGGLIISVVRKKGKKE
ncbi:MAG: hypothetical protein JXN65_10200 [Clostridia bacterium]|nr:hypothetical protein [Clostridia bacterium]